MKYNCVIGKIREISFIADNFITKRIKEENLPILRNHIPLFYILPENGNGMLFNELSSTWNISKSSLSDIISKYENLGLVNKCDCAEDKRSIYISLTAKSIDIKSKLDIIEEEFLNLLLINFDIQERDVFEDYIDKALENGIKIL